MLREIDTQSPVRLQSGEFEEVFFYQSSVFLKIQGKKMGKLIIVL